MYTHAQCFTLSLLLEIAQNNFKNMFLFLTGAFHMGTRVFQRLLFCYKHENAKILGVIYIFI